MKFYCELDKPFSFYETDRAKCLLRAAILAELHKFENSATEENEKPKEWAREYDAKINSLLKGLKLKKHSIKCLTPPKRLQGNENHRHNDRKLDWTSISPCNFIYHDEKTKHAKVTSCVEFANYFRGVGKEMTKSEETDIIGQREVGNNNNSPDNIFLITSSANGTKIGYHLNNMDNWGYIITSEPFKAHSNRRFLAFELKRRPQSSRMMKIPEFDFKGNMGKENTNTNSDTLFNHRIVCYHKCASISIEGIIQRFRRIRVRKKTWVQKFVIGHDGYESKR